MAFDLRDRFETTDGARPDTRFLDEKIAKELPLAALAVLRGGDAFEQVDGRPPADGEARARAYVQERIDIRRGGLFRREPKELAALVEEEIVRQLEASPILVERLRRQKPIGIDLVPKGQPMSRYGFPDNVVPNAAGLFWDQPAWPEAKIALRGEHLPTEPALVVHEMAHAIHYLAFTSRERELIYRVLRPTFGSPAAMDEVFAIYSERELLPQGFDDAMKRAPGVYGVARAQWSEGHLFTRFVRKLYFPHKKLAGSDGPGDMARSKPAWAKFSGG